MVQHAAADAGFKHVSKLPSLTVEPLSLHHSSTLVLIFRIITKSWWFEGEKGVTKFKQRKKKLIKV